MSSTNVENENDGVWLVIGKNTRYT